MQLVPTTSSPAPSVFNAYVYITVPPCCTALLQVCSDLEASRVRVDEELVSTAQLVTQLEARLQEALQKGLEAEVGRGWRGGGAMD